jgi:SAM-dependent methyltransferase
LVNDPLVGHLVGVDVDVDAIQWCKRHVKGDFRVILPDPPTDLGQASVDVVYAVSVFSHFSEAKQLAWLAELCRVLKVGGLFLASTHSPSLTWTRPDLRPEDHRELAKRGFLFAPAHDRFNEDSTFHSADYLGQTWGAIFEPLEFTEHGLGGYQDLSIWRKRPAADPVWIGPADPSP